MPPHLPQTAEETQTIEQLSNSLNISTLLATLLWQRGISNFEEARLYFRPSLTHLHDPMLMKDMDKAVVRLTKAIETGENIMIFG